MELIGNVEELLQELMLLSLSNFVLFGPSRAKLFIKCCHLILLLNDHMVNLNFDAVATLFQEFSLFLFSQLIYGLYHSIHFWITKHMAMHGAKELGSCV